MFCVEDKNHYNYKICFLLSSLVLIWAFLKIYGFENRRFTFNARERFYFIWC